MAIALLFLLLALPPLSQSEVFTSIDCGSSESYTDENSIKWTGDGGLIRDGESLSVRSGREHRSLSTLRVFNGPRRKYCYEIAAEKGEKVLLRATFYYGNYDGKSAPPSFALLADGNVWEKSVSFTDVYMVMPYEAIYVPKGDRISVCVARTKPGQFPIISAIEVRSVGAEAYAQVNSSYALLTQQRFAYGANTIIRYPDDPYDRLWIPGVINPELLKLTNEAPSNIEIKVEDNNPPRAALKNAVASPSTSQPLIVRNLAPTAAVDVPVCINMYFSEAAPLAPGDKRAFVFAIEDEVKGTIVPSYGTVTKFTAITTSSKTKMGWIATEDSTLPPFVNALEIFYIGGPLAEGTNSQDLEGLASLQKQFSVLQEWTGDPCQPAAFKWDWLDCSSDVRPRVTALYLNGFGLKGSIPDFSSLDALETIDMHNNSLTGPIPEFLFNLPYLKELNLADNKLSGSIPTSVNKNRNLKFDLSGNPVMCSSGNSCVSQKNEYTNSNVYGGAERKRCKLTFILGAIVSSFFAFF